MPVNHESFGGESGKGDVSVRGVCVLSVSGWPVIPCPDYCVEEAAHHHHDEQGLIWINPGETCGARRASGAFYEDHERDMQDPVYRKAFERMNRVLSVKPRI